jgi:RNA 2',3'-cyclic 3'-phosphodiesterase
MIRIFIGIPFFHNGIITEEQSFLKKKLHNSNVKWVEPGNFHITLKFIGEIGEEHLQAIVPALEKIAVCQSPMILELSKPGFFGSARAPKVLWYGLKQHEKLHILSRNIEQDLISLGIEKEEKEFHAHITLGRVKNIVAKDDLVSYFNQDKLFPQEKKRITSFHLLKSDLKPHGPIYTVIREFNFGGKD